jgi:arylamine N-acetyltransferase
MQANFNLDLYLERIGVDHTHLETPCLDLLNNIIERHLQAIVFENLELVMHRGPIDMSVSAVQAKLVGAKRGG